MKKSIFIAALMAMTMGANAQWLDFSTNNERYGAGFHVGMAGWNCEYSDLGFGVSLNLLGMYFDYMKAGPEHRYDNHVTNTLYDDSVAWHLNVGYQIPILPWLRVMPLIGYCQTNAGITDATTVNIEVDDNNNARMFHDYDVTPGTRRHYFNFGGGLFIQPIRWAEIYAVGSRHAIYGGISLNLSAFVNSEEE